MLPKTHPGPFMPAREAELRKKPAHYCVHEVWPELDAQRARVAELEAALASVEYYVREYSESLALPAAGPILQVIRGVKRTS